MNTISQCKPLPDVTQEYAGTDIPVHHLHYQFTRIVEQWTDHLQYKAWQITDNKQAAEDIVQEAFLALWQQRTKIIPEKPVGWLIKVVTNLSVKYKRNKNTQVRIYRTLSENKTSSCTDVEEYLLVKEQRRQIRNIFNQLPAQQKIVLHLSREIGLRRTEIAVCLRLSPNTVKFHLHRAMQFMKDNLICILIFGFLFLCNNIFFRKTSTNDEFMESYRKKLISSIQITASIDHMESPGNKKTLAAILQETIHSIKQ